jgi:hypothetical protein
MSAAGGEGLILAGPGQTGLHGSPGDQSREAGSQRGLPGRTLLRVLWRNRNGRVGLILVGLVVLGVLIEVVGLTPDNPQTQDPNAVLKGVSLITCSGPTSSAGTCSRSFSKAWACRSRSPVSPP